MLKKLFFITLILSFTAPFAIEGSYKSPQRGTVYGSTLVTSITEPSSGISWDYGSFYSFGNNGGVYLRFYLLGSYGDVRLEPGESFKTPCEFDSVQIHRSASTDTVYYEVAVE